MIGEYILVDHTPVLCDDVMVWGKWMQNADRHVAQTYIGEIHISTVFLGLDHNFGDGIPILFETMVFGGILDQEQDRYCTWEEAEVGHEEMVKRVVRSQRWYNRLIYAIKILFGKVKAKVTLGLHRRRIDDESESETS